MSRHISALFVIVSVLALSACASTMQSRQVSNSAKIGMAKVEMANLKQGFFMYMAENESNLPETSSISSYEDLVRILSPLVYLETF